MCANLTSLFDTALGNGVRHVAERYGVKAADGAITLPTLEAALEVLPLPHRCFVQEHLDYYWRRYGVMEKEGAEAVLVVWSLEEPLVWMVALNQVPGVEELPWVGKQPLQEPFRDTPPLLTRREALRQIEGILRAEGFTPQEEPVLLPPDIPRLVEAVMPGCGSSPRDEASRRPPG